MAPADKDKSRMTWHGSFHAGGLVETAKHVDQEQDEENGS